MATTDASQNVSLPVSLDDARIRDMPLAAYYIPDFLSVDEERAILDKIVSVPKPRWTQLTHRRLQTWPSELIQNRLVDAPLPDWLNEPVVSRLQSIPVSLDTNAGHIFSKSPHCQPNHVLINEYPPGIGIMPHKDGAAYHPIVCTVSLGSSLVLDIHKSKDDGALDPTPVYRVLQEPRSLLITTEDIYTDYLHGIADVEEDLDLSETTVANWSLLRSKQLFVDGRNDRGTRISLTYRDVLKVTKLGNKFSFLQKR
ncbi:calpain [Apiospora arundinis]|jgi:alkylated DNA repair protein alkB family protein 6|uniref:Alkbh6 protein n=1 Tax=Apiospora arundinis TaxID=335852 RepID=A0ABR2J9X8_9PEZI